jgi:spore coat polysaccharide biosynthesis protein SpsF
MWKNAKLPSEREHVTQYILHNNEFKIGNFEFNENLSQLRWTLDHEIDLKFLQEIIQRVQNRPIFMRDVLQVLSLEPELTKINSHIDPDEGLKKSKAEDEQYIKKEKLN